MHFDHQIPEILYGITELSIFSSDRSIIVATHIIIDGFGGFELCTDQSIAALLRYMFSLLEYDKQ